MAKTKFASHDEAIAAAATAKEEKKAARQALKEFEAEKGLKHREDHSENEDGKVAKQWKKLNAALQTAITAEEEAEAAGKALKPKKEREAKYDYPEDCVTAEQKKKYRAEARAAAKKAAKGEAKAEKKEKASTEKVSEKSSKKAEKKEKKAKVEDKDED
jgi:hypothetical protein